MIQIFTHYEYYKIQIYARCAFFLKKKKTYLNYDLIRNEIKLLIEGLNYKNKIYYYESQSLN